MAFTTTQDPSDDRRDRYIIGDIKKGAWTFPSPMSAPEGFLPTMTNFDVGGGILTAMLGDSTKFAEAVPSGVVNLFTARKVAGSLPTYIAASTSGIVWKYVVGTGWVTLRTGLSTSATLWWSHVMIGTDLFIANPVDGIFRYDGLSLIPVGASEIAQAESNEAAAWTNETNDTVNFREGLQSFKVTSGNPGASAALTYQYISSAFRDLTLGRLSADAYAISKTPGTDFYHFWVKFSNGAGSTITAATTKFVVTDSSGKTLTWAASLWRGSKSPSGAAIPLNDNNWHEVFVYANDATDSGTYDPTHFSTAAWTVVTSAGQTDMSIDDIYVIYASTMPAVQIIAEWKNMLFGAQSIALPNWYFFSKVAAPDLWYSTAGNPIYASGDSITGMSKFFNQLVIGTDQTVQSLSGTLAGQSYPSYIFDLQEVTNEAGISSHRSIIKAINRLFWWYNKELIEYSGTGVVKRSYPVDTTLGLVDTSKLQMIVGARFRTKNQLWFTYPRAAGSVNDRIIRYDYQLDSLLPTEGLSAIILYESFENGLENFLSVASADSKIYLQSTAASYKFTGTDIVYTVEFDPVLNGNAVRFEEFLTQYMTNIGNISVYYRVCNHLRELLATAYTLVETIDQATTGEQGRSRIDEKGVICQVKLVATGVPTQLQPPFIYTAVVRGDRQRIP